MASQTRNYASTPSAAGLSALSNRLAAAAAAAAAAAETYHYDSPLAASTRYLTSPTDVARLALLERASSSSFLSRGNGGRVYGSELERVVAGVGLSSKVAGGGAGAAAPRMPWTGVDGLGAASVVDTLGISGIKRQADVLYHQSALGTHNTTGQSEALFSSNSLVKRPRIETVSSLPIYPQRPGEKDCTYYMLTRTCKFGDACKFDHPLWVPEGGIPDWKEVPLVTSAELLPERPGQPDCPYMKCSFGSRCRFNHPKEPNVTNDTSVLPERPSEPICSFYSKTGKCKFGANCIYHHPKDLQIPATGQVPDDISVLPERPSEPICSSYSKTGKCKFGVNCIYHHPKALQIPVVGQVPDDIIQKESTLNVDGVVGGGSQLVNKFATPAMFYNKKGLPIRQGEENCPFYLKTGSCKYGAACRYSHPDRAPVIPHLAATISNEILRSTAVLNAAASFLPGIDPRLAQAALGDNPVIYPQRPGELECDHYMKFGKCNFGDRCKFHHPIDRAAPTLLAAKQQPVKLTLAGLPRREGAIMCPFYMKTGSCKYSALCRYDHPPPGEVMSMVASQASGAEGDADKIVEANVQE